MTETSLCALLSFFKFELPQERIVWNVAGVNYPTMGDDPELRMLMKVSSLKQDVNSA